MGKEYKAHNFFPDRFVDTCISEHCKHDMQLTELEIAGRQGGYLNCLLFVAMCEALGSIPSGEKEEQVKTPEFK